MPDYTTHLHLVKLAVQQAQKEADINENSDKLTNAIGLLTTKSLTALSSPQTLSESEARAAVLKITNASGAFTVKVPVAYCPRVLHVYNNSGQAVTVLTDQGGSTGVTLANGYACLMWHDGTHVYTLTEPVLAATNTSAGTYAEGTATLALKFGGASVGMTSTQVTKYSRIGNTIFLTAFIALTAKGSSTGAATITGLPVAASTTSSFFQAVTVLFSSASYTGTGMGYIDPSSPSAIVLQVNSNGAASNLTDANFTNTTNILINAVYKTS